MSVHLMTARRALTRSLVGLFLCTCGAYVALLVVNDVATPASSTVDQRRALDRGIAWLSRHHEAVVAELNPALFWMLATANEKIAKRDERLDALVSEYRRALVASSDSQTWRQLIEPQSPPPAGLMRRSEFLPGYNVFFLYCLTCDRELDELAAVQEELSPAFCPALWFMSPHCATHQLMGLLWGLHIKCNVITTRLPQQVAAEVRRQLLLDFMVDDAYVQRTLMLAMAHTDPASIRPSWITQIVRHQLPDGGWASEYCAVPLPDERCLQIYSRGLRVQNQEPSPHTTIQAVLLLARLQHGIERTGARSALPEWATIPP